MADELSVTVQQQEDLTTVNVAGKLVESTADTLRSKIDGIVESKPKRVEANLAGLELVDDNGVAALVMLYKRVKAEGGTFKVTHARDQPLAIFRLLRMDKVFL